jgi:predicted ATPase
MIYLERVTPASSLAGMTGYPYSLPVIQCMDELRLDTPVTLFVGENGTGKSTLLESIAASTRLSTVGGKDVERDPTLAPVRDLSDHLRIIWAKPTSRGFFMRAEDFFNFASRMTETAREMDELADSYLGDRSYGALLARGSALGQRTELARNYGDDLHARSHGEAFLQVFQSRFVPGGLYLLDEPDTALSPLRQLALISLIRGMVELNAQFIIATHSPMLMAYPGATIYRFGETGIRKIPFDEADNVVLMRDFLANPELFLQQL